jgi:hypothetical protein
MPAPAFFARYASEFARQVGSSQENADRPVSAQRLLAKAEYELYHLRRELSEFMEDTQTGADELEEAAPPPMAARPA